MGVYLYPSNTETELKNAYIGELLPTSVTLDKSSISLTTVGQTEQLTATVEPEDAPRKTVTWSSDDTSIATVSSSGLVTCVTPGSCTITATTVNGLTASCEVDGIQGWDFSKWTLSQTSGVLSSIRWGGVFYNPNGTKLYLTQYGNGGRIYECNLSTPYDITTIDNFNKYISINMPEDIHFSPDGTKMYIIKSDDTPYSIMRYSLSTAWDISTATQDQTLSRNNSTDRGLYLTPDGTKLYIGYDRGTLIVSTLSTAWDLSTASSFSQLSTTLGGFSIWFGDDGKILLNSKEGTSTISYHKMTTAYDLSTINEEGSLSLAGTNRAGGMWWNDRGTMCTIVGGGGSNNYVTKYTLS